MKSSCRIFRAGRGLARWMVARSWVLVLAEASAAAAQEGVRFEIPRQRADAALTAFAQQADIPVLFPFDRVSRLTANPLIGEYPVDDGLKVLLEGTGLTAVFDRTGQLTVQIGELARENTSMNTKRSLFGGLFAAVFAGGTPATAPAQETTQSASARAMLEEIVVTARRTEENLMELPLSVSAITAAGMEAQGIYNVQQLTNFVPNISLTEDVRANDTVLYIRGLGGGFSNPAQVFGTAMYIDGHVQVGNLGAFNSTADIERIEVLRGPQGTLFGKNTTGGAISIITAKPGPDFDSYVTLRAGDYGQQDIRGMVNFPINDSIFMRLNAASETTDGYWYDRTQNKDTNAADQKTYGIAVRFLPGDNWTVDSRIALSYDRDDDRGATCRAYPTEEVLTELANAGFDVSGLPGPFDDGVGFWGGGPTGLGNVEFLYPGATVDYMQSCETTFAQGHYVTSQDFDTKSYVDNEMISIDAMYDSEGGMWGFDNVNWQFKGARRYNEYRYLQDRDWTELKVDGVGMSPIGRRGQNRVANEFEVIFTGDLNESLNLVSGVYYLDDEHKTGDKTCLSKWLAAYDPNDPGLDGLVGVQPGPDGELGTDDDTIDDGTINGLPDDNITCALEGQDIFERLPDSDFDGINANHDFVTSESLGVYGHMSWAINDAWELDFGARYSEDTRTLQNVEVFVTPGSCSHDAPGDQPPTVMCTPEIILNRERAIDGGAINDLKSTWDDVTTMISLTRHLAGGDTIDSGIVYFLISEGYLTGSWNDEVNTRLTPGLAPFKEFSPEYVTNYELGFKGTILDGRVSVAADVFYMIYEDKQEAITLPNPDGLYGPDQSIELTQNASDVELTGIEFELRTSPWEGGFVSLDFGYIDQDYKEFVGFDPDTFEVIDLSDSQTISARTPEWTIAASVEHAFQLGNGGTITPNVGVFMADDYQWQEGLSPDEASRPRCLQDSYTKVRTRVTYEPAEGNWTAAVFGSNITDELVLNLCGDGRSGVYRYSYEPPAWWGAEFTMRFGGGN